MELQKPNAEAEVYGNNKKNRDWKKKKKLRSLIRFHNADKIDNLQQGAGWGEKKKKKSKRNYRTSQNIRINVFLESLLLGSFPLSQPTSPP